jgi:hypothetical protein
MPQMGFEFRILVLWQGRTFHAVEGQATVIGT